MGRLHRGDVEPDRVPPAPQGREGPPEGGQSVTQVTVTGRRSHEENRGDDRGQDGGDVWPWRPGCPLAGSQDAVPPARTFGPRCHRPCPAVSAEPRRAPARSRRPRVDEDVTAGPAAPRLPGGTCRATTRPRGLRMSAAGRCGLVTVPASPSPVLSLVSGRGRRGRLGVPLRIQRGGAGAGSVCRDGEHLVTMSGRRAWSPLPARRSPRGLEREPLRPCEASDLAQAGAGPRSTRS